MQPVGDDPSRALRGYKSTLQKTELADTGIDLQPFTCLDLRHAVTRAKLNSVEVIILFGKEVMRDAKRISVVLKAIEEAWRADPDLRLGQIVVTATNLSGRKAISPEVFSLEDEDLLRGIEALVASQKKKGPNQPPQRNAGSRPFSDDTPASETPSSLGPRG